VQRVAEAHEAVDVRLHVEDVGHAGGEHGRGDQAWWRVERPIAKRRAGMAMKVREYYCDNVQLSQRNHRRRA
jgi:hypothetical protein